MGAIGPTTEVVTLVDPWEGGGGDAARGGRKDVMTRVEERSREGWSDVTVHLQLFGPWGAHLYTYAEDATETKAPATVRRRTSARAVDLDGDGSREIVLIERTGALRTALDATGSPADEPGPFYDGLSVKVRYLTRAGGSLAENELAPDPDDPAFAALLSLELGGAVDAALQLAAADALFGAQQFEKAHYRYQVAREWAERSLSGREVAQLDPKMPLVSADPDDPVMTWMAAIQRIGSLPLWYQKR
jgi:hypothetical protein